MMVRAPPVLPANTASLWAEGYRARLRGAWRYDNPYLGRADFRQDNWDAGWLYADEGLAQTNALITSVSRASPGRGKPRRK